MNRKIKLYRALIYIVLFYLAAAFLLLGPIGVLEKDRLVAGLDPIAGQTEEVRLERQIQQVFLADGGFLRYLELYVLTPDAAGDVYHLTVYDETNQILVNRDVMLPDVPLPGFVRIPLGIETVAGRAYVWQLQGRIVPMRLAWQHTAQTGLTIWGNYYTLENGRTTMHEAQNVLMRLVYLQKPSFNKMAALWTVLLGITAVLCVFLEYLGRKRQKLHKEIKVQRLCQMTFGPVLWGFTLWLLYGVFVKRMFGGAREDKIVYGLGIGIACAFFSWVLFAGRGIRREVSLKRALLQRWKDWLQAAAFAGVLLGCVHYMNAQFQFYQDCAYREVLLWVGGLLLTMAMPSRNFCKWAGGFLSLGGALCFAYYQLALSGEAGEIKEAAVLLRYDMAVALLGAVVVAALIRQIWRRREALRQWNPYYALPLGGLLACLVIFRNTRGWPVYLAVVFSLFYLFWILWERREHLLENFCDGVTLHFALALVFALARRPFRAWEFSRYNFIFHTVTITATYLTLVICVLTVRLFVKFHAGKKLSEMWGSLVLYGMAMSLLFFTLSRTGYLATLVMIALLLPFAGLLCYRHRVGVWCKRTLLVAVAVALCLPVTFCAVRLLPALYNDPYIYPVEDSAAAIHRDDPKDSTSYMSLSYFRYVMKNKLLSRGFDGERARQILFCLADPEEVRILPGRILLAADGDAGLSPAEDFSNGRLEIFRCYRQNWNLTGHPAMGVTLPDGSLSVHAHNTYLQVIHDHGLVTGALFLIFGLYSFICMTLYALRACKENPYAPLPLAVFIGFAVAGLVEWLFHPCNPMGFSMMVMFTPFLAPRGLGKHKKKVRK